MTRLTEEETTMRRLGVTVATVLALSATTALAQGMMQGQPGGMMGGGMGHAGQGPGGMMGDRAGHGPMMGMGSMMGDPARHMEGRLAFIEAELNITDRQRPAWDDFVGAMRDAMGGMTEMHARMASMDAPPPLPERLALMEEAMASRLAALRDLRDEAATLYEQLSPEQRTTADGLMGMM
jgi:hypothetical protein